MRDILQLEKDFELYFKEIERCKDCKCYWALLHVLLTIPDVCATLETNPNERKLSKVGERYVEWCKKYFPPNTNISGEDRYQMRNALLHSGSTTAFNLSKRHQTTYIHFSYVTPEDFEVQIHGTNDPTGILNIHPVAMADETVKAIRMWFSDLQGNKPKMLNVVNNINKLSRIQAKRLQNTNIDSTLPRNTISST